MARLGISWPERCQRQRSLAAFGPAFVSAARLPSTQRRRPQARQHPQRPSRKFSPTSPNNDGYHGSRRYDRAKSLSLVGITRPHQRGWGTISSEYNGYGQDFDRCFLTTGKIRVAGCNAPGVRTGSQPVTSGVPRPSRLHRGIVPGRRSLRAHRLLGGPAPICAPPPLRAAVGLARKRLMRCRRRALALQGLVRRPRSRGIRLATGRLQRLLPRRGRQFHPRPPRLG